MNTILKLCMLIIIAKFSTTTANNDEMIHGILKTVTEQLEKFNNLYVSKLESRMISTATLLTNIDANIKNLQERAHVWDTFQLHVSAWNEQIKALDRKVDILNRGQEQLPLLDGKVTQLLSIEEHITRLSSRVDDIDTKLISISKAIEENNGATSTVPLLGEFATRGVLSTLKNIERKVERLGTTIRNNEHHHQHGDRDTNGGRLVVKCQSPPTLETLLNDVASKVDVLYDRFNDENSSMAPLENDSDLRSGESAIINKVFRRLVSPLRRTWKALEGVERALRGGEEIHQSIKQTQREILTVTNRTLTHAIQGSECCAAQTTVNGIWRSETSLILSEVKGALHNASLEREQISLHLDELNLEHNNTCSNSESKFTASSEELEDMNEDENDNDDDLVENENIIIKSSTAFEDEVTPAPPRWMCHELVGTESGVTDPIGDKIKDEINISVLDERDLLYCDQKTSGGGWTVVQRRGYYGEPKENFTKNWIDYENGFGNLKAEFWLGLKFLYSATFTTPMKLRVELADFDGNETFAEYSIFKVNSPETQYRLTINDYFGNATDSLGSHDKVAFSTIDKDNDEAPECCPCAPLYGGGWWFYSCFEANLNGEYYKKDANNSYYRGIIWEHWRGDYSLAKAEMKIRPLDFEPR